MADTSQAWSRSLSFGEEVERLSTAGALDVLEKPNASCVPEGWERNFISTVKLISRIKVITHRRGRLTQSRHAVVAPALWTRCERSHGFSHGCRAAISCLDGMG